MNGMNRSRLALRRRLADVSGMTGKQSAFPRPRPSACADAAFKAELERVKRMTIEERVKASLSMRERFAWLEPTAKPK